MIFVSVLKKMGARLTLNDSNLTIERDDLNGVEVDLKNSPDLFPVLATLCAFAQGQSLLYGAPQLSYKESARIAKTSELLRKLGRKVEERADGLLIEGRAEASSVSFDFDPDKS